MLLFFYYYDFYFTYQSCYLSSSEYQKPMYENSDLARRFLRSDAPLSLQGYIQHCNELVWPLFSHLESAVREGTNQYEKAFGRKSDDLFQVTVTKFRSRCVRYG